jgi:O-antigen ligase
MPLRVLVLTVLVGVLAVWAFRDWFFSLCGLIVLLAAIEHPDVPRAIMGIRGLSPMNLLMVSVLVGWVTQRRGEGLRWDMPGRMVFLLLAYLVVFLVAVLRMFFDPGTLAEEYTFGYLVSENLINTVKWVVPGLLLYDGCRSRQRFRMAVAAVCLLYLFQAIQVVQYMPPEAIWTSGELRARMRLADEMGLTPAILGKAFACGTWGILAASVLLKSKAGKLAAFAAAGVVALAEVMVGSRSGYLAWVVVGVAMCAVRWRAWLAAIPVALVLAFVLLPGARGRVMLGFGETNVSGGKATNLDEVFSGREKIWPYVVEKICDAPVIGYGKDAAVRTGITATLRRQLGRDVGVGHAHNIYLNMMLESGAVGLFVALLFFGTVLLRSARLFAAKAGATCAAAGGMALAAVLGYLVSGVGSQHFYPQEGDIATWCTVGLVLRVLRDLEVVAARNAPTSPARAACRLSALAETAELCAAGGGRGGEAAA